MKAEKEKTGFLAGIKRLVTQNWGLKLLSLALAIIIYYSLTDNATLGTDINDRSIFHR